MSATERPWLALEEAGEDQEARIYGDLNRSYVASFRRYEDARIAEGAANLLAALDAAEKRLKEAEELASDWQRQANRCHTRRAEAEAALRPFAAKAQNLDAWADTYLVVVELGACRRAAAVLNPKPEGGPVASGGESASEVGKGEGG